MPKRSELEITDTVISGREVEMFRTHYNPMITPTSRQAFMPKDLNFKAFVCDLGVHCIMDKTGAEHLIPYANIESIRLVKNG